MDVSLVLVVVMAVLFAAGVMMMLERSLTRVLIGFLLLGNAANLLLMIAMGMPGIAPFSGDADSDAMTDPLPQALTLTAIVITFAVSAFLLALIYRSWQLGKADIVADDEADIAVRKRSDEEEDSLEDEGDDDDDEQASDFVGEVTAPLTVLDEKLLSEIDANAGVNRPYSYQTLVAPKDDDGPRAHPGLPDDNGEASGTEASDEPDTDDPRGGKA